MAKEQKLKKTQPKLTTNQKEYNKQVTRIKGLMKGLEKRGYIFVNTETGEILEVYDILPQKPKKLSQKYINSLKEIRANDLYEKSIYRDLETGLDYSGVEGKRIEKQRSARKSVETRKQNKEAERQFWTESTQKSIPHGEDIIYNNLYEQIANRLAEPTEEYAYSYRNKKYRRLNESINASEQAKTTLLSLFNSVIARDGVSKTAWRLEEYAMTLPLLLDDVLYGSTASKVNTATSKIANILTGGNLTMSQLADLEMQSEYNEGFGDELYDEN